MSIVDLRIELPAYSNSFTIQIPNSCSVLEVKEEISRTCPGRPRVDGQRLIWRGRYLGDQEKVEDIWKSPEEPRVVHLAVHPSAWSSSPPRIPETTHTAPAPPPLFQTQTPRASRRPQNYARPRNVPFQEQLNGSSSPNPLAFVVFLHQNALLALQGKRLHSANDIDGFEVLRASAIKYTERQGWTWPSILDDAYPAHSDGGLRYRCVDIESKWYLSLDNPSGKPTAFQAHALHVLSYTFTLLSTGSNPVTAPHTFTPTHTIPIPANMPNVPNVNEVLQQLGLREMRVANQNAILPELREMPLRPLVAPVMMLVIRTVLILYFVAPARKPVFGILILAWMLYEIWQPIRNGLRGLRRPAEDDHRANVNNGAREAQEPRQNGNNPPNGVQVQPAPGANVPAPGAAARRMDSQLSVVLDTLANTNIDGEQAIIDQSPGAPTAEPGIGHKIMTFVLLLITTVHPAVWNRRRVMLRRREGAIRTEASIRNAPGRGEVDGDSEEARATEERAEQARASMREQWNRRPRWVQQYMERVVNSEWVDDAD